LGRTNRDYSKHNGVFLIVSNFYSFVVLMKSIDY